MNHHLSLSTAILGLFLIVDTGLGELPSRADLLQQKYAEDRAKGITALNQRYIDAFQKELDLALQSKKLEEANAIQIQISDLEKEVEALGAAAEGITASAPEEDEESLLVGKSLAFPHNNDPSILAYLSFQKEGQAQWLGTGNQSVERKYKKTGPRTFTVWWPARPDNMEYEISIDEDGKTAEVKVIGDGSKKIGVLERTR